MAGLRETIPFEGNPVLEAFTAGASMAGASGVAEASTVAEAGDSSYTRGSSYKGDKYYDTIYNISVRDSDVGRQ